MFPKNSTVVCGLSGGADSTCLTLCLFMLKEQLGINVEALHVNHCLRGEESDRDEEFCRNFCQKIGIKFVSVSCDVNSYAKAHSMSLEEAARKMRYDAFSENSQGKILATAHNANDNLETVILNLSRGTALKGLAGIPPVRDNIVRPLLAVSRSEIEVFLKEQGFCFVTDSTNLSDDCTRNIIRHNIMPVLSEINSSVINTSVNAIDAVRTENSFIDVETSKAYNSCKNANSLIGITMFHEVIRKRCIAKLLTENSLPYSYERLKAADEIALNGGKINISRNIYLTSDKKNLKLEIINKSENPAELSDTLKLGKNTLFANKSLYAEIISSKNLNICENVNTKSANYFMDYDKIIGSPIVRNRRFGDKIKLAGRSFTSSVKKLINELIPVEMRSSLYFIEDSNGTIFAEQLGIADHVAPDSNTVNYLKITVKED